MDTSQQKKQNLEQIFSEAEDRFRQGLTSLADWSEQARSLVQERPGVLVASIAIAGFMTGLVLRRGGQSVTSAESKSAAMSQATSAARAATGSGDKDIPRDFFADPVIVFITSAIAGFTAGPKMVQLANESSMIYRSGRMGTGASATSMEKH